MSFNDWTKRTLDDYVPRCEKACAICARKDWIENRARVFLWDEATGSTSSSRFFYKEAEAPERENNEDEGAAALNVDDAKFTARLLTNEDSESNKMLLLCSQAADSQIPRR